MIRFLVVCLASIHFLQASQILITGCGRSGTAYIALLLQKSGYDIKHERPGSDGCVSWSMAVNQYSVDGPYSDESFGTIFHQTRHPLSVISSWITNLYDLRRLEWVFIRKYIPEIVASDSSIISAAKYWYYWNLLVEAQAEWRYAIEKIDEVLPEFMRRSGLTVDLTAAQEISKKENSWASVSHPITWNRLRLELPPDLYVKIQALADRYGYSICD